MVLKREYPNQDEDWLLVGQGAWVTINSKDGKGDLSVHIYHPYQDESGITIDVYPKGLEMSDPIASTEASFEDSANEREEHKDEL